MKKIAAPNENDKDYIPLDNILGLCSFDRILPTEPLFHLLNFGVLETSAKIG